MNGICSSSLWIYSTINLSYQWTRPDINGKIILIQIIIILTYHCFALIIKFIYVDYKSGSHDELCNALLISQEKCYLCSFYLLASTEIFLLYNVTESYKKFVDTPYLAYNTCIFYNSHIVFHHLWFDLCCISSKCFFLSWIYHYYFFLSKIKHFQRISTIPLAVRFYCCFIDAVFCSHFC